VEHVLEMRTSALNSAEAQIQSLFKNTSLGIALSTYEGEVISANQGLLDMFGYTDGELRQGNITAVYSDPRDRKILLQQLKSQKSVQNFGVRARRKDGTDFVASLNVSLVTHNERDVILTVVEDVTEKSRAEEALRTSQNLLQSALDALTANIAVLDENGGIVTVNASWRAFGEANGLAWANHGLGRSYLEPLGVASAQSAVGVAEAATGIQALLSGQQDRFTLDYPCSSPSEDRLWTMRASRFENNEGVRVVVSHEDITERVQAAKQIEHAAAIAERDRIARELHDAVTQTLFAASGIAEATPRIWRTDPAMAQKNMENLTVMLRGALAEMRNLLLELRPDVLRGQSLSQLLQTLIDAARSRTSASISLLANGDCDLPEEVIIACHRIAQEALNNAVRHAGATEICLTVDCTQHGLVLKIGDNGRGFDQSIIPAGHFGLKFIGERVDQIGGTLVINSRPAVGTDIVFNWHAPEAAN
jgi:PAS domain S-box-containing protein